MNHNNCNFYPHTNFAIVFDIKDINVSIFYKYTPQQLSIPKRVSAMAKLVCGFTLYKDKNKS